MPLGSAVGNMGQPLILPSPKGHFLDINSQQESTQPSHGRQRGSSEREPRVQRILLAIALTLTVLLVVHSVPTQIWELSCHRGATGELFQKHPSETPEVEQQPVDILEGPRVTTLLRLARRQDDNTTASSTPPTSSSASTSSITTSTSASTPTTSSSSPPARNDGSTTTTSGSTSSTSTNNRADPTSTSSLTVASGSSPSNTGTLTSGPSPDTRAASVTTIITLSDAGVITTLVTNESRTPSTVNGGTTLTRSTTLPQTPAASRTSKMVVETLTSTLSNGNVVVVTQTTYVPPDPVMTTQVTTASSPSLHNSSSRQALGCWVVITVFCVVLGIALI